MSRKIFISMLGTSYYNSCQYFKGEFTSNETRFVQEAILKYINVETWGDQDVIMILLTQDARKGNWDTPDSVRYNGKTNNTEPYKGLKTILSESNYKCQIRDVDIPNGTDEDEMWDIFTILYRQLEEGDELYFDLTHAFRYLPMLVLVFGNYVKFLKKAKVAHISYGNFEARKTGTNRAPIVDLLPISTLQDWTFASANYLENGNADRLIKLCEQELTPILRKESAENKKDACLLNKFKDNLKKVVEERRTYRGISIVNAKNVKALRDTTDQITTVMIRPLEPILNKIKESLPEYDDNENVMNGFKAAEWCFNNGLYQQAGTIFHENIITLFCFMENLDWKDPNCRAFVNTAFHVLSKKTPEYEWRLSTVQGRDLNEKEKELIKRIMNYTLMQDICKSFEKLNNLRNDINHSGMRKGAQSDPQQLKNKLSTCMKDMMSTINMHLTNSH